jgi:hypothetical protein
MAYAPAISPYNQLLQAQLAQRFGYGPYASGFGYGQYPGSGQYGQLNPYAGIGTQYPPINPFPFARPLPPGLAFPPVLPRPSAPAQQTANPDSAQPSKDTIGQHIPSTLLGLSTVALLAVHSDRIPARLGAAAVTGVTLGRGRNLAAKVALGAAAYGVLAVARSRASEDLAA